MKYIMFEVYYGAEPRNVPIIFPDELVHSVVAEHIRKAINAHWRDASCKAVSAGTYHLAGYGGKVQCFDKSDSMRLKSREKDAQIIEDIDQTHGIQL